MQVTGSNETTDSESIAGDSSSLMSSINVTPFVDVALVLLVIFMVTAPIIAKDILKLTLPKTETSDGKSVTQLGVAVNMQGQILLNGILVSDEAFRDQVKQVVKNSPDAQAIISADVATQYGNVVHVIDLLKSNGLNKFAVQIEHR